METKDQLVQHIKEWIGVDEEIKSLQKEIKIRKEKQKELTKDLMEVMKTNEIDCFECNSGQLMYTKNNVKKSINKKYLNSILNEYFQDYYMLLCILD